MRENRAIGAVAATTGAGASTRGNGTSVRGGTPWRETQCVVTSDLVDAIRSSLSPQMADRGFGPGGPGWSSASGASFLYCIGAQEFARRYPSTLDLLRTRTEIKLDEPSWCLDFVIEGSPSGAVERLDFEFVGLDTLLEAADHDRLARECKIDQLRKLRSGAVVARIAEAVSTLMPIESAK